MDSMSEHVECVGCCERRMVGDMRLVGGVPYCAKCRAGILKFRLERRQWRLRRLRECSGQAK